MHSSGENGELVRATPSRLFSRRADHALRDRFDLPKKPASHARGEHFTGLSLIDGIMPTLRLAFETRCRTASALVHVSVRMSARVIM